MASREHLDPNAATPCCLQFRASRTAAAVDAGPTTCAPARELRWTGFTAGDWARPAAFRRGGTAGPAGNRSRVAASVGGRVSVAGIDDGLTSLDAAGLLAASSDAVCARLLAEDLDLEGARAVGRGHSGEPTDRGIVLVQLGGEGAPGCRTTAWVRSRWPAAPGSPATVNALADRLDLEYRLPRRGRCAAQGRAEVGIARRVASCRGTCPLAAMRGRRRGGRADHRLRVRRPGARRGGGQDHRGRPGAPRGPVEAERRRGTSSSSRHRRVRAAHGHRALRGRRRGLDRGHRVPGRGDHRAAAPRRDRGRAPVDRVRLARPPAELLALLLEHRDEQEARPELAPARPAPINRRWPFPADLLDALRERTSRRWRPRRCSTSTSTRPPSPARRRRSARVEGLGRSRLCVAGRAARPHAPGRQAGHRPVRPDPVHRLRAPRVAQGTRPPGHRRRLLALRHLHPPRRRLRPPDSPRRPPDRRGRPAPTTPAHSADDITAGRPTPATAPDSAAQADTSG